MNPNSTHKRLEFIISITADMNMQSAGKIKSTRSLGPKTLNQIITAFGSITFHITIESTTFISRKKQCPEVKAALKYKF